MTDENRKFEILRYVIRDYIETGEAVGSRTIEKKYAPGISSATIRNEMSDLEELGYLIQPHTSAGRVPTQQAYRLYVDKYLKLKEIDRITQEKVKLFYTAYAKEYSEAIKHTADLISSLTGLTAVVTTPHLSELNIRDVKLILIENERILMVIITKQGIVKTSEVRLSAEADERSLEHVANFLNACLKDMDTGFTLASFTGGINALDEIEQGILSEILLVIRKIINENNQERVYTAGTAQIFDNPEFKDAQKARKLIDILQKDDLISYLLYDCIDEGINIRIGTENELSELSDCALITSTYSFNGRPVGTIALIGSLRLDYDYAVSAIHMLTKALSDYFNETLGGK